MFQFLIGKVQRNQLQSHTCLIKSMFQFLIGKVQLIRYYNEAKTK